LNIIKLKSILDNNLPRGDFRRLIHGRGGAFAEFKHLTLDSDGALVMAILHESKSKFEILELKSILEEYFPKGMIQDRSQRPEIERYEWGALNHQEVIKENSLLFELEPFERQNFGFFPDMSAGRRWVTSNSEGKRVLNLFSFTCAFSVAALAGNAQHVVNVDMSSSALARGRRIHHLNNMRNGYEFLKMNIMKSWGRIKRKGPYDLIICDPPSQQMGSFFWERDYPKVIARLSEMLNMGGRVMACLNAPKIRRQKFLEMLTQDERWDVDECLDPDDVFINENPEEGLKMAILSLKT
jgi:23S rRNA (cytosine1962-C5)-methyltransferase